MKLDKSDEFIQTFKNEGVEYHLTNEGVLVEKEKINLQEQMNSRVVDTLTDLFNKYMNGEVAPVLGELESDEVVDYSEFQNKDKLDLQINAIKKHKQTLKKYNLPENWTPEQLLAYVNKNAESLLQRSEQIKKIENEKEGDEPNV